MLPAYREDIADTTEFRWQTIKGVKHYCFRNVDEFHKFFGKKAPQIAPDWRTANEGDWVIADDGGVVQILKMVKKMGHPRDTLGYSYSKGWCRTVVGTFLIKPDSDRGVFKMDTDWKKHKSRYTFGGSGRNLDHSSMNAREHLTKKERQFVFAVLFGDLTDIYDIYGKVFPNGRRENIKKNCDHLMKQERIMTELEKGVKEAAEKQGLDHEWVLSKLKEFADTAETDADKIRATIKVGDSIGTFNEAKKNKKPNQIPGAVGMFKQITEEMVEQVGARPEQIEGEINE